MVNEGWIKRQTESFEARRRYEEERLILWTAEAIWTAMDDRGLSRADLAETLGTSRANVTQLLSGTRNMTLRSLAALAHACGLRAGVSLEDLSESVFTELGQHLRGRVNQVAGRAPMDHAIDGPSMGSILVFRTTRRRRNLRTRCG